LTGEPRPDPKTPLFRRVVSRALASPLNLSVVGLAGAGSLALHSLPLAALGAAAYAALVALDLVSPKFWQKALERDESAGARPTRTLEPRTVKDAGLRRLAEAVRRARGEVDDLLGRASPDVRAQLSGVGSSLDELERRASGLVTSGDQLVSYLARSQPSAIQGEIAQLQSRVHGARDAEARGQYEQTIHAREEQLNVLTDIASALDRINANLWRIVATLEGLAAKIVRMSAMDVQAMDNLSGDINADLERMNREIDTFEETLRPLVAAKEAAPV
jgi:hypothetical protein